ncbi:hypothetical protein M3Y99_00403900 [Aphelenchoides fujianensis]|nr:hypothetical protein M3Y99_00403900 [Aphelenchoides fujianensis]
MDEHNKHKLEKKPSEILTQYVRSLSHQDLVKILTPIKARLLSEETVLCLNTMNFSVEHVELSSGFIQLVLKLDNYQSTAPIDVVEHVRYGGFESIDMPPTDFVSDFIDKLSKHQKRAVLMCARDGLLTDESFLNVSSYNGPDRIQVSMKKVVEIIRDWELHKQRAAAKRSCFFRVLNWSHFSSADFERAKKADLEVRQLVSSRQKMSVYFTLLFALMTFFTFFSHIWSNITNYKDIQDQSLALSISILVLASLLIGVLMYLVFYLTCFLFCCESSRTMLSPDPPQLSSLEDHFGTIHKFKYRIYATRLIQFVLLWYTMLLAIYAHEMGLNIYPALTAILSNGFGLMLFMRITHFLHACRKGSDDPTVLYAR